MGGPLWVVGCAQHSACPASVCTRSTPHELDFLTMVYFRQIQVHDIRQRTQACAITVRGGQTAECIIRKVKKVENRPFRMPTGLCVLH